MSYHVTTGRWKLGVFLAFITALLWAAAPIALKVVLDGMGPITISWFRFTIAMTALAPYLMVKEGLPRPSEFKGFAPLLALAAIGGLCVNQIFFMTGLDRIPPGAAVVVIQSANLFFLVGGLIVFRESFGWKQMAGCAAFALGLVFFFNERIGKLVHGIDEYAIGVGFILVAALGWALYALAQKQLLNHISSLKIMLLVYAGGCACFLPLSSPKEALGLTFLQGALLLFAGLNTVVGYGCFSEALDHAPATRVSSVLASIPILSLIMSRAVAALVPGYIEPQPLNWLAVAGAFMVMMGSITAAVSSKSSLAAESPEAGAPS